jgi:hypothetical protein
MPTLTSLAGRTDTEAANAGEGAAAGVQFIAGALNTVSINLRISSELRSLAPTIVGILMSRPGNGALAIATLETFRETGGTSFRGIFVEGYYADSRTGMRHFRVTPSVGTGGTGIITHRYFWGIRSS